METKPILWQSQTKQREFKGTELWDGNTEISRNHLVITNEYLFVQLHEANDLIAQLQKEAQRLKAVESVLNYRDEEVKALRNILDSKGVTLCRNCNSEEAGTESACPYSMELDGSDDCIACSCCDSCRDNCHDSI